MSKAPVQLLLWDAIKPIAQALGLVRAAPKKECVPSAQGAGDAQLHRIRSPRLQAQVAGDWVDVRLDLLPDEPGYAFVKQSRAHEWASVPVAELDILRLIAD